jgi:tryptophan-rich sensory protein
VGGIASARAPDFYIKLDRPPWAPPAWLFGPVWTTLYILMGIAAWMVWKERGWGRELYLFVFQLVLNAVWTWLFFGLKHGKLAALDIIVLAILIVMTIVAFWNVRSVAGVLLVPYLAWVVFATALTFSIVSRNPQVL